MSSFNLNIQIYRPLTQVFKFVASPENDFQWQYGTLVSTQISEGVIGVGSFFRSIGHFMGHRIISTFEVTDFEQNKKYGYKSLSGPIHSHTLYTFEAIEGSTKVNISTQINPENSFNENDVIVEKKVKKQCKENLVMLKTILEAR